jgi:hypothetical protein
LLLPLSSSSSIIFFFRDEEVGWMDVDAGALLSINHSHDFIPWANLVLIDTTL